jgi:hypothetical protein
MSETMLAVGSAHALRVVLKHIQVWPGVGTIRFMFTFELATKQQSVVGHAAWLTGRVELDVQNGRRLHLASFQPQSQPLPLPALGVEHTLQLAIDITEPQLQLIEESRTEGVQLTISLSGYAAQNGENVTIGQSEIRHDISQSDWLLLLQRAGYRRRILVELAAPSPETHPDLAAAIDYYRQAQQRYAEGEWRLTVESLRQSLASVVGNKADDEEQETDIQASFKALRSESRGGAVGYEHRTELVRQAVKFMCDLGAHPEVAETRRQHAYGALVMVGGLLHALQTN